MNQHAEFYLLTAFLYFLALSITVLRTRNIITPFHFCWALFIGELLLAAHPLMIDDFYGRTKISAPHERVIWILIGAGLIMGFANVFLRRNRLPCLDQWVSETRLPRNFIILIFVGMCLVASARSVAKLHTFPLFILARDGVGYSEVFEGFVTYLGWGAGRALAVWLTLEAAMWAGTLQQFIRRHFVLCAGTVVGITLNVLDGQRNLLIIPLLLGLFALSRLRKIKLRHIALGGLAILLFFTAVGAFRMGESNRAATRIKPVTHISSVDNGIGNIVTYLEPNINNLNNLVRLHQPLSYGKVVLYGMIPDRLLNSFLSPPESALDQLTNAKMFSHPGLTFRTVFADLYVDFGAIGAVLLASFIYTLGIYMFNRADQSPRHMLAYLILAQGIMNFPTLNTLLGIPSLIQVTLFFLLRFQYTEPSVEAVRPFRRSQVPATPIPQIPTRTG
jgi:oligosaccharide repeat unit polymerase